MLRFRIILKHTISIFVAAVLIFSAYGKVVDSEQTKLFLESFGWIPNSLSQVIITAIIICEIILALMLTYSKTQRIGAHLSIILFFIFTIILLFQSVSANAVDCGCFGSFGGGLGIELSIVRNIILMLLLSTIIQYQNNQ